MSLCVWALPARSVWLNAVLPKPGASHGTTRKKRQDRWQAVKPLAGQQQVSALVPQPQPPPLSAPRVPPPWAINAGIVAVAAAAIRVAWANRSKRQATAQDPAMALPSAAAAAGGAAGGAEAAASSAVGAARAAVQQAGQHLVASDGFGADEAAGVVGPLLLAAETGGAMDETATMSLDQLQKMATELYLLIQQMEMQLQEVVGCLAELLPKSGQAQLDELAQQIETVEEQLAGLKGCEDAEGRVMDAECAYSDLQWRLFELVTAGAAERERRTLRSLLFNITTQRQLLRQVEQQEALRLRMRGVEQRIALLLDDERQQLATVPAATAATTALPPSRPQDGDASSAAASQRSPAPPLPARAAAVAALQLRLLVAGTSIPHPSKAATGGEDAFFLSSCRLGAIGVADGVGGWAAQGIDPSLYPRALMSACKDVLEEGWGRRGQRGAGPAAEEVAPRALEVLEAAYRRAEKPGSSTVILGTLLPGGRLSVANLGDCELKVLRDGHITFSTQVLEHEWNMPLQLSCASFYDCGSRPEDADVHEVEVAPGDVVVVGSDGLWDNLWEAQVEEAVAAAQQQPDTSPQNMAEQLALLLARAAHRQSLDPGFSSPFAVERQRRGVAGEAGGLLFADTGGKPDDVTVVVAVVADE